MQKISRQAAVCAVAGGALTAVAGIVVQAVVVPNSTVSEQLWSYPWPSDQFTLVSILYAIFHVLVCVGMAGFARSGLAGDGRVARIGAWMAFGGTVVLFAAELASIPVGDQLIEERGPSAVGAMFGVGTVVAAIGFLLAGVTTLRAGRWQGWRRFTPLVAGLTLVAITGSVGTDVMSASIAAYGIGALGLGLAMLTQPDPRGVMTDQVSEPRRAPAGR
ncbi:hypothetical protein AMIS_24250 [Actinoplanes missouriensis 431]|uniref:DUF998 domain-containing protein n=2 Tax=Actinoplanes missouriensis TaxID=1866 RepID=I0H3Q8_ACTM4|nr:hypothetical protein AMIS_24250 [Actinoplanes missouriensis 431]